MISWETAAVIDNCNKAVGRWQTANDEAWHAARLNRAAAARNARIAEGYASEAARARAEAEALEVELDDALDEIETLNAELKRTREQLAACVTYLKKTGVLN